MLESVTKKAPLKFLVDFNFFFKNFTSFQRSCFGIIMLIDVFFFLFIKYKRIHLGFTSGEVLINDAKFIECRALNSRGGSITSVVPTTITNSFFSKNLGGVGGSCNIISDLTLNNTIFDWNRADIGGCIASYYGNINMNKNIFKRSTSSWNGAACYMNEINTLKISLTNCTSCVSGLSSCGYEIQYSNFSKFQNCIISYCSSRSGDNAIFIKYHSTLFSKCLFYDIKAQNDKNPTVSCITFISSLRSNNASLSSCQFYKCSSSLCTSLVCKNFATVKIIDCCFSGTIQMELQNQFSFSIIGHTKFSERNLMFKDIPHKYLLLRNPIPVINSFLFVMDVTQTVEKIFKNTFKLLIVLPLIIEIIIYYYTERK